MTVFPFGAARCIDCKAPVAIVRQDFEYDCSAHGRVCHAASLSIVTVDGDGHKHRCLPSERPFGYTPRAGASGEPNRLNVAPAPQLAPGVRVPFHVGSKTT